VRYAMQGEYVLWIMASTVGLLQGLAAHYRWAGLSFFRGKTALGYICAAILVPGSYYWFFSFRERDVPGLEGWQLFSRFVIGAALGLALVLALSSLLNARRRLKDDALMAADSALPGGDQGIDALRHDTYAGLLAGLIGGALDGVRRQAKGGARRE
jgi:hypothetical protein